MRGYTDGAIMFPNHRVAAVLLAHRAVTEREYGPVTSKQGFGAQCGVHPGSLHGLSETLGIAMTTVDRILKKPDGVTKLETVDQILCALNCVHLFHVAAEHGGFADLYEKPVDLVGERRRLKLREYRNRSYLKRRRAA